MLVLSRRASQKVVFPGLGISLSVLRIKGNVVKIGVEAPSDVKVLRAEVANNQRSEHDPRLTNDQIVSSLEDRGVLLTRKMRHEVNNALNAVNIGLHLLSRQLETKQIDDASSTFQTIITKLDDIEKNISNTNIKPVASNKHALIIEDDENERELLASYMRLCGMKVTTAKDGIDALQALENEPATPDIVLLDMNMPNCNGPEFIKKLRDSKGIPKAKIFGVSGFEANELGLENETMISKWYSKPFNPEKLVKDLSREIESDVVVA